MGGVTHLRRWLSAIAVALVGALALASVPAFAATPPAVESEGASNVTPFEARLEAVVNPNESPTTCHFEYATNPLFKSATSVPCEPETLEGSGGQGVGATITGLTGGTTYYFRAIAENAAHEKGEGSGELTTLVAEAPLVEGESLSALTGTSATFEGVVNPNYQETNYRFEYATNEAFTGATSIPGAEPLSASFGGVFVSAPVTGLAEHTDYFFRVVAENPTGTTAGTPQPFETFALPGVTTGAAEEPTQTTAEVSGTVDPQGLASTYHFAYVEAAKYNPGAGECVQGWACAYSEGMRTEESASIGEARTPVTVAGQLRELRPGTTYHYALVASNSLGTTVGPDMTVTTNAPTPPVASTGGASGVSTSSATLTGAVDTRELPTSVAFEFGTSAEELTPVPATVTGASGSTLDVAATLSGVLRPSTTYYFRTVANNADGLSTGALSSFTTAAAPAESTPSPALILAWPPFVGAGILVLEHQHPTTTKPKLLTRAQKLAKALNACSRKPKRKRASCRRQAKRRYR